MKMRPFGIFFLLTAMICLNSCSVFKRKPRIVEVCGPSFTTRSEIAKDSLVRTGDEDKVTVYGIVRENEKGPQGILFFTDENSVSSSVFLDNAFGTYSISLVPGIYAVKVSSEKYEYEIGKLELKRGEVRNVDFTLKGYP